MYRWDGSFDFKRREDWDYKLGTQSFSRRCICDFDGLDDLIPATPRHSYSFMAGMWPSASFGKLWFLLPY